MSFIRIFFCLFTLFLTSIINYSAFASAVSGIDLSQSTIEIEYTPDAAAGIENNNIFCFSSLTQDDSIWKTNKIVLNNTNLAGKFKDKTNTTAINESNFGIARVATDFEIDIQNDNDDKTLTDCFKNAGDYKVTIVLSDAVGNTSEKIFNFTIMPGDVNVDVTTFTPQSDCENSLANGIDTCSIDITLRDQFGNIVYNVQSATINYPLNDVDDTGNLQAKFVEGIQEDGSFIFNLSAPRDKGISFSSGVKTLKYTSVVPTIVHENNVTSNKALPFDIILQTVSNIDNDGKALDTSTALNKTYTPNLKFDRPIYIPIRTAVGTLDDTGDNDNGNDYLGSDLIALGDGVLPSFSANQRAKISLIPQILGNTNFSPKNIRTGLTRALPGMDYWRTLSTSTDDSGSITETNIVFTSLQADEIDKDDDNPLQGVHSKLSFSGNSNTVTLGVIPEADNHGNYLKTGISALVDFKDYPAFEYIFAFGSANVSGNSGGFASPKFDFNSLVEYTVGTDPDSRKVRYYANEKIGDPNEGLGVFIEGTVIKKDDATKVKSADLSVLAGVSQKDIRETINRNAFSLERAANNIQNGNKSFTSVNFDTSSNFGNTDVIVVKNKNAKISGELPTGKNTLIVIDGNVLISGDTWYKNKTEDSFGLIVLNTKTTETPTTGNIFVHTSVQNMRGAFYADGGLMGTAETNLADISVETAVTDNTNGLQLRLVGTLLTKNTVGGTFTTRDDSQIQTPWGVVNNSPENIKIAERYDLLYLRNILGIDKTKCLDLDEFNQGSSEKPLTTGNCSTDTDTGFEKGYSFILRFDRKVLEQSPPGFTNSQVISR